MKEVREETTECVRINAALGERQSTDCCFSSLNPRLWLLTSHIPGAAAGPWTDPGIGRGLTLISTEWSLNCLLMVKILLNPQQDSGFHIQQPLLVFRRDGIRGTRSDGYKRCPEKAIKEILCILKEQGWMGRNSSGHKWICQTDKINFTIWSPHKIHHNEGKKKSQNQK